MTLFKWWKHSDVSLSLGQKEDLRSSSLSAVGESGTSSLSPSERFQRVTPENIQHVTPKDVRRIQENLTMADFEAAMRYMLQENRFVDVITYSNSAAWQEAARDVKPVQKQLICSLIRERISFLYNVLPFVSESFLQQMASLFKTKTNHNETR
ncbi:unnamed protein product [Phytomonas sp. EM1]|nr:unnamed protein product [Phytomonas sp. EM1]|eukprot:CCW64806.1 unnamed protein product [Phytomonas sp. isolate EM1]